MRTIRYEPDLAQYTEFVMVRAARASFSRTETSHLLAVAAALHRDRKVVLHYNVYEDGDKR